MIRRLFLLCALLLTPALFAENLALQPGTVVELADPATGAKLLGTPDAYLRRMSSFDREARMRTAETPTMEAFAKHCADHAREFTEAERKVLGEAVAALSPALTPLKLPFPATVTIVKTDGGEDIGAPYCRGPMIVFPEAHLRKGRETVTRILAHELFHVFSNGHPEKRTAFYALLGYRPCRELQFPPEQDRRRFTNPDAMDFNFHLPLKVDEAELMVIPVMLAKHDHYDPAKPDVFKQVEFVLAEVRIKDGQAEPVLDAAGRAVTREPMPAFLHAMAQNTNYIWHPEEVLADNFIHLLLPPKQLKNPELPKRLLEAMQ